jgi:uncharacterized protein (TIGR03083 family)
MTVTITAPDLVRSRRPALDRATAMRLAATEYQRITAQLRELPAPDWSRPTGCAGWDVQAMACHVLGMAEMAASLREQARQFRAAKRRGGLFIDALTAVQVSKHTGEPAAEIVAGLAATGPKAVKGRRRTPAPMRRIPLRGQPVDETGTQSETWTLGYLVDVILTRDTFMHRSDIAAATGRPMELSADHEGVLVADIAAEWAARHGQACTLALTGPAGGAWAWGDGGRSYRLDAIDFCRILSGRGTGEDLLTTRVPF